MISAYCVFQVANRYTFGFLFGVDFSELGQRAHMRRMIGDVVVGWLTAFGLVMVYSATSASASAASRLPSGPLP